MPSPYAAWLRRGCQATLSATALGLLTWESDSNPLRIMARQLESEMQPSSAVLNQRRSGPEVTAICSELRLPPPELAQHMPALQLRGFLNREEVDALLTAARGAQRARAVGVICRDRHGEGGHSAAGGRGVWRTAYLHTDNWFESTLPQLAQKLREGALRAALERPESAQLARYVHMHALESLHYRTVELHTYGEGGGLRDRQHYDAGSLLTIDVMLSRRGADADFEGGEFSCPRHDDDADDDADGGGGGGGGGGDTEGQVSEGGGVAAAAGVVISDGFGEPGDVIVFPSHKYHNVLPVTRGQRTVMVMELWSGPPKVCAHRCLVNSDAPCEHTLARSHLGDFAANVALLG
jgi:hypothetical protein